MKEKGNNTDFLKIFCLYIFGGSLFPFLFVKIYSGGVLMFGTCSNINFEN